MPFKKIKLQWAYIEQDSVHEKSVQEVDANLKVIVIRFIFVYSSLLL